MASIVLSPLVRSLHGRFGNIVLKRGRNGRTIAAMVPQCKPRPSTPKQLEHRDRFRQAAAYAHSVLADEYRRGVITRRAEAAGLNATGYLIKQFLAGDSAVEKGHDSE